VDDVWIFPPNAGKLCNPLDNTLWHSMKQRVRKRRPDSEKKVAKVAKREFMKIAAKDIHISETAHLLMEQILTKTWDKFSKKKTYTVFFLCF